MALPAEKRRYTFADVLTWDESEQVEIIGGEVFMRGTPSSLHQEISGEMFRQLANYLEGKKCRIYHPPFAVRLFERDGDSPEDVDTMVEPDLTVVCDHDKLDEDGCKGAPDMVVENSTRSMAGTVSQRSTSLRAALSSCLRYLQSNKMEGWESSPPSVLFAEASAQNRIPKSNLYPCSCSCSSVPSISGAGGA